MRRTVTPGLFCADLGRLVAVAVKLYGGQYLRALDLDSLESVGIETERLENRWRDLLGFDRARDGSPIEAGIRQSIMTLVSSCEKPPCSASFLVLPE